MTENVIYPTKKIAWCSAQIPSGRFMPIVRCIFLEKYEHFLKIAHSCETSPGLIFLNFDRWESLATDSDTTQRNKAVQRESQGNQMAPKGYKIWNLSSCLFFNKKLEKMRKKTKKSPEIATWQHFHFLAPFPSLLTPSHTLWLLRTHRYASESVLSRQHCIKRQANGQHCQNYFSFSPLHWPKLSALLN